MEVATGPDGKLNVLPLNQDLFIIFCNKELFAAKGLQRPPKTLDEMMTMAHQLTDPSKGVYGFVGRGLKNANMTFWDDILLKLGPGDRHRRRQEAADRHAGGDRGRRSGTRRSCASARRRG